MIAPGWMHQQITAEQYDSWSEEQCSGIEIVDGMVVVTPSASARHNRPARRLANALEAAGDPEWFADLDFDVRLQDVPFTNSPVDYICRFVEYYCFKSSNSAYWSKAGDFCAPAMLTFVGREVIAMVRLNQDDCSS
jgi:hypothetical protein